MPCSSRVQVSARIDGPQKPVHTRMMLKGKSVSLGLIDLKHQ